VKLTSWKRTTVAGLLLAVLGQGCAAPDRSLQYVVQNGSGVSWYRDYATSIEYPADPEGMTTDPELFRSPRTITTLEEVEQRPITLNECIRIALGNAAIIRDDQGFLSPGNPLLANPQRVPSIYDSAIQDTGFLFGSRGTEASLSDFDPVLTSSLQAGRSEDVQNTANIGLTQGDVLTENNTQWQTRLEKSFANSGTFSVENNWTYSRNNQTRLFDSAYTGNLQAEYRQPLLAASGTEFTRIAGPAAQNIRGVSGVSQGVLISRINSDISLLDFEQSVTQMIRDVENKYWDLYLSLHLYHSEVMTFRDIVKYGDLLATRAEAQDTVYQAQNRLYEADARIKGSLADVLQAENRLRRLLGLPLNDGQFLTPTDHPSEAKLVPSWDSTLTEALANRTELRRQKWEIQSLELQLRAARNLNRPRLDVVSQYRVNGFGDTIGFIGEDDDELTDVGYKNALESLSQGNNTGWGAGLQFSMPLGLRLARAQVRNYELRLRKARRVFEVQEEEVARELNNAILEMDRWYLLAESGSKRADVAVNYAGTAEERVSSDNSRDPASIGRVLEAKITSRDADQSYLRSIVEYNKAITELNYRKGTLLQSNSIYLAEGEWNPLAYQQAAERGKEMTQGIDNEHLETVPEPFTREPAPAAWEATGEATRPFVPGALDAPTPADAAASQGSTETAPPPAPPKTQSALTTPLTTTPTTRTTPTPNPAATATPSTGQPAAASTPGRTEPSTPAANGPKAAEPPVERVPKAESQQAPVQKPAIPQPPPRPPLATEPGKIPVKPASATQPPVIQSPAKPTTPLMPAVGPYGQTGPIKPRTNVTKPATAVPAVPRQAPTEQNRDKLMRQMQPMPAAGQSATPVAPAQSGTNGLQPLQRTAAPMRPASPGTSGPVQSSGATMKPAEPSAIPAGFMEVLEKK
jgi:outer membrane protein TolC